MEVAELNNCLVFVRKNIKDLEDQIKALDGDNWSKNVRGDYDKEMIYSNLQNILSRYRSMLRKDYDCEQQKKYYAFGKPVPQRFINELLADNVPEEEITTEYLETLLEYEQRDQ